MLSHGEQQLAAAGAVKNIVEQAGVDENNYNRVHSGLDGAENDRAEDNYYRIGSHNDLAYLNVRERLVDKTANDIGAARSRAAHENYCKPRACADAAEYCRQNLVARIGRQKFAEKIERGRENHRHPHRLCNEAPADENKG